jgi:hypothetical protein
VTVALTDELMRGSEVVIETTLTGPLVIGLEGATEGPPSPLVTLLKPKVTVRRQGVALFSSAPAGEPGAGFPVLWVGLGLVALLLVLLAPKSA